MADQKEKFWTDLAIRLKTIYRLSLDRSSIPAYLIEPAVMFNTDPQWLNKEILVIDFGQPFFSGQPPVQGLGTPLSCRAPEVIFRSAGKIWSDIWTLGCVI